ncbi:MAG: hypothetical protein RMJ97_02675 [Raineya sp.]|nr:hypothetical protein [Raineya sp.]MDW8295766.1 hypothetical protein [Raineya sp.]
MNKYRLFFFYFIFFCSSTYAQHCFKEVALLIDTLRFTQSKNTINFKGEKYLAFEYFSESPTCEVRLYPQSMENIQKIDLAYSQDFQLVDSVFRSQDYFRFKVKFNNLTQTQFPVFNLVVHQIPLKEVSCEVRLFPYFNTKVAFAPKDDELYVGEERVFELICNNPENIRTNPIPTTGKDIDYRTELVNKQLRLYVLPSKIGEIDFSLDLSTFVPYIDEKGRVNYQLPPIKYKFLVKGSRLAFVNVDVREITIEEATQKEGVEVQLDYNRFLSIGKTYRIENQEKPGGMLVAEIFTKSLLSNGKILCVLRPYGQHRISESYLYIKNGDEPVCITNFNVTPKTIINNIIIFHEGNRRENVFYPGEVVDVRIEGLALHKARFRFDGLNSIASDSLIRTENVQTFRLQVPLNISKKEVEIFNRNEKVGRTIPVSEYQRPHQLNFVRINYGAGRQVLTELPQTILYPFTIKDIEVSFDYDKIDENKLFGRQFVSIDVTIFNAKGDLVDLKRIPNIMVCPSENSPRFSFYSDKQCNKEPISLNKILGRKTFDLDGWSRIEITISHDKEKYGGDGFSKKIEIILQRKMRFDTEVTFPGGLLIKRADQPNFSPFGGISLAIIQQLSFYTPNKINRLQPYKVGIGILANNAFNFNPNATNRDIGVVLLGSLYPARRDVKLSFPLFAGMGYFLSAKAWFFLIGPGIFVSF